MPFFINVILPIPIQKLFTYSITETEAAFLSPGMRVAVPFGKSKIYTALVSAIHENPPIIYEAKEIHQILDDTPVVNEYQLKHWFWLADYYMCTIGEVFRAAIPKTFLLESETLITAAKIEDIDESFLKDDEFLIYEALQHQSSLRVNEVSSILERKNVIPVLKRLLEKQVVVMEEEIQEQYKPKLVRYVKLAKQYEEERQLEDLLKELSRAKKQQELILTYFSIVATNKKPLKVKELIEEAKCSTTIVKSLIDKGIFEEYFLQTDRVAITDKEIIAVKELNEYQQKAFLDIKSSFKENKVTLLHGVTSSGKTEVYVKLIAEVLSEGKQVLFLLPEIALTTQLIKRLELYFNTRISVFHSKYSLNERTEVWNNVLKNKEKAQIILGARSSVFLPFSNLGLIVIDEEHEGSFKQFDPAPRYHARDTAIVLGHMHGANVLLGSATPSIESYHNARTGKYGFAEITKRYANVLMPEIELVDIKDKMKRKRMTGHFSDRLLEEITETLAENEQIIIFQNRRGYAPIMECVTCGESPQCPNCDVSLTYHQYKKELRCHYCSYHMALQKSCLACGSTTLDYKGFGTEQVQEELQKLFPKAVIGRMDMDTTRGKFGYEKIITAFEQQEIDVLVGTQMLTKGLDFRNVRLVGIMNADTLLNFPDFRAHERSYQLLVQVAGRAGRTAKRGKVVIQSYNPYHQILKQVSTNNYAEMFKEQLYDRETFKYPPKLRIIKITFRHRDYNKLNAAADWFATSLKNSFKKNVLGPEFPSVMRIRNMYLKHIIIKIPEKQSIGKTKHQIKRIQKSFESIPIYKGVYVIYNVDYI